MSESFRRSASGSRGKVLDGRDPGARPVGDGGHLTAEEVAELVDAMTAADRAKALSLARLYADRCRGEAVDLYQEAIVRALGGERRCPREVTLLQFLKGIMKSLASQAVESWKAGHRPSQASDEVIEAAEADAPTPETVVASRRDDRALLARIEAAVEDDFELQLLLEGIIDGLKGAELAQVIGIDTKALASLQRKFQRRIADLKAERALA